MWLNSMFIYLFSLLFALKALRLGERERNVEFNGVLGQTARHQLPQLYAVSIST